jgi:hypothetical protein
MANPYGPWATLIDAGGNPQLSAFWRRRLTMLVPASRTSPALARRQLLCLGTAVALVMLLPTLRSAPAVGEEKKPSEQRAGTVTTFTVNAREEPANKSAPAKSEPKKPGRGAGTLKLSIGKQTQLFAWSVTSTTKPEIKEPELKELIAKKQYKFVRAFEAGDGETRYVYRFRFADGQETNMNFLVRLEDVTSWDDYGRKVEAQSRKRQATIEQAAAAGRCRLINLEVIQVQLCRDRDSHQRFKIQHVPVPDGNDQAFISLDSGPVPKALTETSWRDHLRAIREGRRELLGLETTKCYTYEMTGDDGTKVIFHYGGDEPLKELEKKAK